MFLAAETLVTSNTKTDTFYVHFCLFTSLVLRGCFVLTVASR